MIAEDYLMLEPDWAQTIREKRSWRNSMLVSLNKSEQRARIHSYPERGIQFSLYPMTSDESNYVKRKLYFAADKVFGVPFWPHRTQTTSLIVHDTTTFQVDSTDYRNFDVGGLCAVIGNHNNYEVRTIQSITSTSITVTSGFDCPYGSWDIGSNVYPVLQGRLSKSHDIISETSTVDQPITIDVREAFDDAVTRRTYSGSSFGSYNSSPVFSRAPNWVAKVGNKVEVYPEVTKYFSKEYSYSFLTEGLSRSDMVHLFESKSELNDVVAFFDECSGRYESFWYPTWLSDVVITSPFNSADTTISIEDIEWDSYYRYTDGYGRFICINLPDSTKIYRRVVSAPTSTSLQLDSSIGYTVTSTDNILCSFLVYGRFATDEIEINYITEEVSEVQLSFVNLLNSGIYTTTTL